MACTSFHEVKEMHRWQVSENVWNKTLIMSPLGEMTYMRQCVNDRERCKTVLQSVRGVSLTGTRVFIS